MELSNIKHLVLSGGGMLGISYIGLVKYLEEYLEIPLSKNLKTVTGCSAGSFFATLVAIGYTYKELNETVKLMKSNEYITINAESIINFMRLKGLESGKNIINFFKKCIKDKVGDENITFKEIKTKFNIELQIGVSNLTKYKFEILNSTNSPDLPVYKAIHASIAIPIIFEPVIIGNDVYCDGGLLDNLPIENIIKYNQETPIEDKTPEEKPNEDKSNEEKPNEDKSSNSKPIESILAIYLLTDINNISKDNYQTSSLTNYISQVIHTLSLEFINKKIYTNNINNKTLNNKNKIIIFKIPCDIMTFLKINSSIEDINNIIDVAYNITKAELTSL